MKLEILKKIKLRTCVDILLLLYGIVTLVSVSWTILTLESGDVSFWLTHKYETKAEADKREQNEKWTELIYSAQDSYKENINYAFRYAGYTVNEDAWAEEFGQYPVTSSEQALIKEYRNVAAAKLEEVAGFGTGGIFDAYRAHPIAVKHLPFFSDTLTETSVKQYERLSEIINELDAWKTANGCKAEYKALNAYDSAVRAYISKLQEFTLAHAVNSNGGWISYDRNYWDSTDGYSLRANDAVAKHDGSAMFDTLQQQVAFARNTVATAEAAVSIPGFSAA